MSGALGVFIGSSVKTNIARSGTLPQRQNYPKSPKITLTSTLKRSRSFGTIVPMEIAMTQALEWKLRRTAAGLRQQDVAGRIGVSTTRYSAIERDEQEPTGLEAKLINDLLPPLPGES